MCPIDDNLNDAGAGRPSDEQLIHALLLHMHDEQAAAHREVRVQRVIKAIGEPAQPALPGDSPAGQTRILRFPVLARRLTWAVAAMILIGLGVWSFTYSPTPAVASLGDILGALGKSGDRTYRIAMESLPEPPDRSPSNDRPPPVSQSPENVPRPNLDNATLYLRDASQYVLERHDPRGGKIFDGCDGRQRWRIARGVLEREESGGGGIPMPPMMANVPFTDLHRTLERIQEDYRVEKFDFASLPSGGESLRHVLARRKSHEIKGPETIEIWAHARTGMPARIIFDDAKIQGNPGPCRLKFDLMSENFLPADWFTPSPHVTGRPVASQP